MKEKWVKTENNKRKENFLEWNENEYTRYSHLWNTMKVILRGKFIALSVSINNWSELILIT